MEQCSVIMLDGGRSLAPSPPGDHRRKQRSPGYCVASRLAVLCFVFSHPIASTKHPSVSPTSGEKKNKAIALDMKLKIIAQL